MFSNLSLSGLGCAALSLALLASLGLNRCQAERLGLVAAELEQSTLANQAQSLALARMDAEARLRDALLTEREANQQQIRQAAQLAEHSFAQESLQNEAFKNWLDHPLPAAVLGVFTSPD